METHFRPDVDMHSYIRGRIRGARAASRILEAFGAKFGDEVAWRGRDAALAFTIDLPREDIRGPERLFYDITNLIWGANGGYCSIEMKTSLVMHQSIWTMTSTPEDQGRPAEHGEDSAPGPPRSSWLSRVLRRLMHW